MQEFRGQRPQCPSCQGLLSWSTSPDGCEFVQSSQQPWGGPWEAMFREETETCPLSQTLRGRAGTGPLCRLLGAPEALPCAGIAVDPLHLLTRWLPCVLFLCTESWLYLLLPPPARKPPLLMTQRQ